MGIHARKQTSIAFVILVRYAQQIFTSRKQSLEQGNVFTGACHFLSGCLSHVPSGGGAVSVQVSLCWGSRSRKAGGMHPTGMLSCLQKVLNSQCRSASGSEEFINL